MRRGPTRLFIARSRAAAARLMRSAEIITVAMIGGCYSLWLMAGVIYGVSAVLSVVLLAIVVALHSSLQHEALHGHPTSNTRLNEALVFLPIGLVFPYRRYRRLHLRHHTDERLTDPYDDPESYYMTPRRWRRTSALLKPVLRWNNTLCGRIVFGPALSISAFIRAELIEVKGRDPDFLIAWLLHLIGATTVVFCVHLVFHMPIWAYLIGVYCGLSILSIRTFCEHQWSHRVDNRTVIVESRLLSILFLNNNLHLVHHRRPGAPWYELPGLYRAQKSAWGALNGGYVFCSYWEVMRHFGLQAKEPVAHPQLRTTAPIEAASTEATLAVFRTCA